MNIIKCDLYEAPSASGGKVWICPVNHTTHWTLAGSMRDYSNRRLRVFALNSQKNTHTLQSAKIRKGYSMASNVWVDVDDNYRVYGTDPRQNQASTKPLEREELVEKVSEPITWGGDSQFNF